MEASGLHSSGAMRSTAFVATLVASVAAAQSQHPNPDAARAPIEDVQPARGASAPRNTKVWLETSFTASDFELRDGAGRAVDVTAQTLAVSGNFSSLIVLTPTRELPPGAYSIARNGLELTAFTVTNEVDTTAPGALEVTSASQTYAPTLLQPRSVGGNSTTLSWTSASELTLVTKTDQTWVPGSALTTAFGAAHAAFVANLPEGKQELRVFHFDLAGNVSQTDVAVDVPSAAGCSVGAGWPLGLLAALLMRRRARR